MSYIKNSSHLVDYQKLDGTIITYDLSIQHTFIKRFKCVFKPVNDILEGNQELNIQYDYFISLLENNPIDNLSSIKEILPKIIAMIDKEAEERNLWRFSYKAPKKISEYKLHIDKNGYLDIMKAAVRSKFICAPVTMLREREHSILIRYIYSCICEEMIKSGTQFKLERIIDSIVLSTGAKGLDAKSQLWEFFSSSRGLNPQNLALRERNAILYKGLPCIETGLNPLNWFVAMAKTSINFQMKDKINELHITISAPIESYENSSDMLKIFIYDEVTSNRKLMRLFNEFPFAHDMTTQYVYPLTNWIAAPFICKVFNISNLNITRLVNILLLNIFSYKFLRNEEIGWSLFEMLTYYANITKQQVFKIPMITDKINIVTEYFNPRSLTSLVKKRMSEYNFTSNTIYTNIQMEELFKHSIKSILLYDYYNSTGKKITIDPVKISNEYIKYLYNLMTGKYDSAIINAREYLKAIIED